jgi:hypothetical protein
MVQDVKETATRERKPSNVSRITADTKIELVKKAIEMAQKGDFSGVAAMAQVEANTLRQVRAKKLES